MYLWNRRSNNKTHTAKMSIIPTSQTTDMVRRNLITPEAVWEERRTVVVVRLPRPMEGNGATPIFRSLQNCQFHHRRLESLEDFNVLYIYISFWALRSLIFGLYGCFFFYYKVSLFCIHFHFASTLCMCVMYLTSI